MCLTRRLARVTVGFRPHWDSQFPSANVLARSRAWPMTSSFRSTTLQRAVGSIENEGWLAVPSSEVSIRRRPERHVGIRGIEGDSCYDLHRGPPQVRRTQPAKWPVPPLASVLLARAGGKHEATYSANYIANALAERLGQF